MRAIIFVLACIAVASLGLVSYAVRPDDWGGKESPFAPPPEQEEREVAADELRATTFYGTFPDGEIVQTIGPDGGTLYRFEVRGGVYRVVVPHKGGPVTLRFIRGGKTVHEAIVETPGKKQKIDVP